MNVNDKIANINMSIYLLHEHYVEIKRYLAKLFILNAQEELTLDIIKDAPIKYSNWLDEYLSIRKEVKNAINQIIKALENKQKAIIEKIKDTPTAKQVDSLKKINSQFSKVKSLMYPINAYATEIELLWSMAINEMSIASEDELLDLTDEEREEFKAVFSASFEDFYYQLLDKNLISDIKLDNYEQHILDRGLAVLSVPCPTVLHSYEIKRLKDLAKRNGIEFNLVEWTPKNCARILFNNDKPETPFKELNSEINLI